MKCWYSKPPYAGAVPNSKKSTGTKTRTSNIVNGEYDNNKHALLGLSAVELREIPNH